MKNAMLFYKCGVIKDFFDKKVEERTLAEYSERVQRNILRNMLTDTDTAIAYARRVHEIRTAVKAEISSVLGFDVDVGFDPNATTNSIPEQITELSDALNMILEGVTE